MSLALLRTIWKSWELLPKVRITKNNQKGAGSDKKEERIKMLLYNYVYHMDIAYIYIYIYIYIYTSK